MANEWWWQGGGTTDENLYGVATGDDGTIVGVGRTDGELFSPSSGGSDFLAVKLLRSEDAFEHSWGWQGGTSEEDILNDVVVNSDGSTVLIGSSGGDWNATNAGFRDFAAAKLSADGLLLWKWQSGTSADELLVGGASGQGSSSSDVVLAGRTEGNWVSSNAGGYDFCAAKLDADGNELWRWQDGTDYEDTTKSVAVSNDGSIFVAGYTEGDWNQPNVGETDFALAKLSSDGDLEWRWQEGTEAADYVAAVLVGEDGGIVLAGYSTGTWGEPNLGEEDFVVIKLDGDGFELWRWQEGTSASDKMFGAAILGDDSVVVTGFTEGDWAQTNTGGSDFCAVRLDANGTEVWRWQDGTDSSDWITAAASLSVAGGQRAILVGSTEGSWDFVADNYGLEDFVVASLDVGTVETTPTLAPTPVPTPTPTLTPMPVPTPTPTPSHAPAGLVVLPPEVDTTPTPTFSVVVLPPEVDATPSPTLSAAGSPGSGPPGPTPAPQEPGTGVETIIGYMAIAAVGLSLFAIGCSWLLGPMVRKMSLGRRGDPSPGTAPSTSRPSIFGQLKSAGMSVARIATAWMTPQQKSMFIHSYFAVSALLSPFDVASDMIVVGEYWLYWHPIWASFLTVFFVLSCRFAVVFAVLHPPPDFNVLLTLYVSPFRVALKHKLTAYKPASENESELADDDPAKLEKDEAQRAEKFWLAYHVPERLRSVLQVWLTAADREGCGWWERLLIGLKFEATLLVAWIYAPFLITGAAVGICRKHLELFWEGYKGKKPEDLKIEDEETATNLSYMYSFKVVEAFLESMPQLSIQTSAFFTIGGDPFIFSISASIAVITLLHALYTFVATNKKIQSAMRALRAIFGADPVAPPPPPLVPPPPPFFGAAP